jgi:hypothetical protein
VLLLDRSVEEAALTVPENVLLPDQMLLFDRIVDDAAVIVIGAEPSKFTPLIARVVASTVAFAAVPPIENDAEDVATPFITPVLLVYSERLLPIPIVVLVPKLLVITAPAEPIITGELDIAIGYVAVSVEVATPNTPAAPFDTRRLLTLG